MTSYEYNNIPDNFEMVSPMPDDLFSDIQRMFKTAQDEGIQVAREAKVAYVYDRKGWLTMDEFGGPRNASYGKNSDDVVIQLTLRIRQTPTYPFTPLQALGNILKERDDKARRNLLEQEIAQLKAAQTATEKMVQAKVDELSKLNVQG